MYRAQQSLLRHLKAGFPGVTFEEYAGQLRDANKLKQRSLPCGYVVYIDGQPMAQQKQHQLDVITVSESLVLNKKDNKNSNLLFSEQVNEYLRQHTLFNTHDGAPGVYIILNEQTISRTLMVDARFTILSLSLQVKDSTP
jgi:hypothetical protein